MTASLDTNNDDTRPSDTNHVRKLHICISLAWLLVDIEMKRGYGDYNWHKYE